MTDPRQTVLEKLDQLSATIECQVPPPLVRRQCLDLVRDIREIVGQAKESPADEPAPPQCVYCYELGNPGCPSCDPEGLRERPPAKPEVSGNPDFDQLARAVVELQQLREADERVIVGLGRELAKLGERVDGATHRLHVLDQASASEAQLEKQAPAGCSHDTEQRSEGGEFFVRCRACHVETGRYSKPEAAWRSWESFYAVAH